MDNLPSMDDQFLGKIHQIIDENLDNENFSVEKLADKVILSRSMLHRKIKKLTGKSASELIMEKRLIKAKELLENNVATASEIAYRVGFNSPSYFNKVFKKSFNISPGELRKANAISSDLKSLAVTISADITTRTKWIIVILAIVTAGILTYLMISFFKPVVKSIAVLPLHNLTGQNENDYFVEGMHDALIGELGRINSLRVISRTSTLRYKNSDMLLKDIAHELDVNTIVEGSVIGAGDSLRILLQLIDVFPKERHLFSNEYHDDMHNVLTVQSSAVKDIAQRIKVRLSESERQRLKKSRIVDPETYKDYLRGMFYLNQGTEESFERGIQYMYHAIERDPGDPFAYAGLALGYTIVGHGQLDSKDAFNRAMSSAKKAIKLDPDIDEAHTALAILYLYDVWDWDLTNEAFSNALISNPNNEIAHAHYAWYYVLFEDKEKALYHGRMAATIEPMAASYKAWMALLCYHFEVFDEAEYWAEEALKIKPTAPYGNLTLSWLYLEKKQYQKAIGYVEKLPEDDDYCKTLRAYVYIHAGQKEKAIKYWDDMVERSKTGWVNSCYLGMMAASLGFSDKAFDYLKDACEKKYYPVTYINFYPSTENLRKDPRYIELLRKMNLPSNNELISFKDE